MPTNHPFRPSPALLSRREAICAGLAGFAPFSGPGAPSPRPPDELDFMTWKGLALDRAEMQYLSVWHGEFAARRPGLARRLMRLHGATIPQIRGLIAASEVAVEKKRCHPAVWPWRSPAEFRRRLDAVQRLFAENCGTRPFQEDLLEDAAPFRPCEARFLFAWHLEWHDFAAARPERVYYYERGAPWPYSPTREAVRRELGEDAEITLLPQLCQRLFDRLGVSSDLVSGAALPKPHSLCGNLWATAHERWYRIRHGRPC